MNLFDLSNNPNFLQCWRERNRPATVGSAITLLLIIEAMIFTHAYFDQQTSTKADTLPWFIEGISALAILQAVILLFFGSIHAYKLSSRERSNGTIDFHRTCPTPLANKIFGLLLGSASLEWWITLLIFAVQLILGFIHSLNLVAIVQFNFQLALTALLYHALFCTIGISRDPLKNKAGAIGLLIGMYFIVYIIAQNALSFIYQLTWLPAFDQLNIAIKGADLASRWPPTYGQSNQADLNYTLFGISLWPVAFQMLVQIPFFGLFMSGIGRRFTNLEQPVFSKSLILCSAFYTLVLFTGSYTSLHFFSDAKYFQEDMYIGSLLVAIMFFAIFGAILATPTQINYLRGLRRAKKLNLRGLNWSHNCSSNGVWCLAYCLLCLAVLTCYFHLFETPLGNSVRASLILLGHVVFFVSFIEFFNLSSMHKKKAILFTTIVILWFLIPLFGIIIHASSGKMPAAAIAFFAPSPIFGMGETILHLMEQKTPNKFHDNTLASYISMGIVLSMAIGAAILAAYERRRLKSLE